jgi:diguanylate cyclase (GGDEF)-like protein
VNVCGIPEPAGWEDPLTGLEGPDLWQRILVTEVARARRYARALTVVVTEVEGILELGDTWGVEIARHALREAGQALRRLTRTSDYAMRIGVTRFGLILTETDEISAINLVERARDHIPGTLPRAGEGIRLSFGWASPNAGDSADLLVRRADARLIEDLLRQ